MLMIISKDPAQAADLIGEIRVCNLPVFAYHLTPCEAESLSAEEAARLDLSSIAVLGLDTIAQSKLYELFPGVDTVYLPSQYDSELIDNAVRERYSPHISDSIAEHTDLSFGSTPTLLGYSLELSGAELSILRLLFCFADKKFTARQISAICFPGKSGSAASVSVLVSRINKKAASISGRRLILCKRYTGYRINQYL